MNTLFTKTGHYDDLKDRNGTYMCVCVYIHTYTQAQKKIRRLNIEIFGKGREGDEGINNILTPKIEETNGEASANVNA